MITPHQTERTALDVAQYEQLKTEQHDRMKIRDHLVYATFAALGGAMSLRFLIPDTGAVTLLAVPLICFALGWTFLRNNDKIAELGRYISATYPECTWESHRIGINGRRRRKVIQLVASLTEFITTGCLALWVFWTSPGAGVPALGISIIGVVLLAVLAIEFIRSSDILYTAPRGVSR